MPDQRDPERQQPVRASDPTLTTRDCADRLGVSTGFVVGEIQEKRLKAVTIQREGKRTIYRISELELRAYMLRSAWCPRPAATTLDGPEDTDGLKPTEPTEHTDERSR